MVIATSPAHRSLLELAATLVRASHALATGTWDFVSAQHTRAACERLADHAANLELESVRMAALDLYIFLASCESDVVTEAKQRSEIGRLAQTLHSTLQPLRPVATQPTASLAAGAAGEPGAELLAVWATTEAPTGLAQAWLEHGIALRRIVDAEALAEQIRAQVPIAILAGSEQIADLNRSLDELARRQPASANMLVVAFGMGSAEDRLRAMLDGCNLYVTRLDDPTLIARVLELTQAPDPPYRVLLVDDDATTRMYVRAVLQQAGIVVHALADPNDVERELAQFRPDLLLLDLFMPDVDGMTLTLRLRARADLEMLPIVFLSGEHGDQARLQAIHVGGDDYLTKPVRPRSLVATVRDRITRLRRLRRQLAPSATPTLRSGRARRGEFLARISSTASSSEGTWRALLAVKIDQAELLREKLSLAGAYELEQSIDLRLLDVLKPDDSFALWQEFGFGLLAERQSRESLLDLAGQLCRAVAARPFKVLGQDLHLSASIGLALPPPDSDKPADSWIAAAFAAQAVAHRLGGNRFDGVLDMQAGNASAERMLLIREAVKQAANGQNILIEFQPMLRLNNAQMDQYAVVVKLRDARAPLAGISRAEFLDSARSAGAMAAIERIAVSRAFEIIEEQHSHGRETQIGVEIDLASLDRGHYLWLEAELRRHGALASRLAIEMDGAWLLERPNLQPIVQRLRNMEVGLTLNEGAGVLSRVAAYQALPATQLRVPYSAVHTLDAAKMAQIFEPWRQSGRALIVDHVEDVAAVMRLWSFGIDYLQGDPLAAASPRLDPGANEADE